MGLIKEFKEFAVRGNAVDMAVGIIVGAAFGKIVSSLVADVVTPPLGVLLGGVDFTGLKLVLRSASDGAAAVTLNYGSFIQALIDFTIIAFAIFMLTKLINRLRREEKQEEKAEQVAPPAPSNEEKLLSEIRDLLKQRA